MSKFSDFATGESPLDGAKERIDDLLNKVIIIFGYRIQDSKYSKNKSGKYVIVQFRYTEEGDPHVFFSGLDVIIDQMEKYKEHIPFTCTIKKINRYYTLS